MAKNVTIAYILWFFLGWLGVHMFYLRRDRHAFFTWATLGGVVGISWLRDLFYIPTYVCDANETDEEYETQLQKNVEADKKANIGFCRWAASVILGYLFALLTYTLLWREDLNDRYLNALALLTHTIAAYGVHLVSNEGRVKVKLRWCLFGSYLALPFTIMYGPDYICYAAVGSSCLAGCKVEWRQRRRQTGFCKRISWLTFIGIIYLGGVSTSVYFNATITSKGETVPLRDAIKNFFTSPAWKETKDTITQIYNYYRHNGWRAIWDEIVSAFDPQGEAHSYEVLGVSSSASQKEIKDAYKTLARKFHPDKEKDPEKKEDVAKKFMEVQKAYDTLSKLKQGRGARSEL